MDTGLDLTLNEVQVGEEIVYGVSGLIEGENIGLWMNVVTLVGGTVTNGFAERGPAGAYGTGAGQTEGVSAWYRQGGIFAGVGGLAPPYTVVAGDLADGAVTLRLRYSAAGARTLRASSSSPLDVWAENIGPARG